MRAVLLWAAVAAAGPGPAGVAPAPVFTDHMVLQRDMPVPVWGTAAAGRRARRRQRPMPPRC